MKRWIFFTGLACIVGSAGCSDDTSKLAATGTGDISNPPALRGSADLALREACGSGALSADGMANFRRRPYLQQVGAHSARVVATAAAGRELRVTVSLPDGSPIVSLDAEVDDSARPPGAEQHVAEITGLSPSTLYCYEVDGLSERVGFRTAPDADGSLSFVAFGDSGSGGTEQLAVYDQLREFPFDFVLHLGDLAYEKGAYSELESRFFKVYSATFASFSVFPAIGNHDVATDAGAPYLESFVLPENAPGRQERQYSFEWGSVHFVSLDTEHIDGAQAEWLDADLAASEAPWTIVLAHRPAYSSGAHGGSAAFRQTFGPI